MREILLGSIQRSAFSFQQEQGEIKTVPAISTRERSSAFLLADD